MYAPDISGEKNTWPRDGVISFGQNQSVCQNVCLDTKTSTFTQSKNTNIYRGE